MVKKPYVIIVGVKPGVHFAEWCAPIQVLLLILIPTLLQGRSRSSGEKLSKFHLPACR
jgi:hypothetical protein